MIRNLPHFGKHCKHRPQLEYNSPCQREILNPKDRWSQSVGVWDDLHTILVHVSCRVEKFTRKNSKSKSDGCLDWCVCWCRRSHIVGVTVFSLVHYKSAIKLQFLFVCFFNLFFFLNDESHNACENKWNGFRQKLKKICNYFK